MITVEQITALAPHCDKYVRPADLVQEMIQAATHFKIDTPRRFAHWLAQMLEETGGFTAYEENLNYSAAALVRVWPKHFGPATAATYAHHPEAIANRAYANRMGNGDEASGDGWRYRGRGALQLTGRANYRICGHEDDPDTLSGFGLGAIEEAAQFWVLHGCSAMADNDDIVGITRAINGGLTNLSARQTTYANVVATLANKAAPVTDASTPAPDSAALNTPVYTPAPAATVAVPVPSVTLMDVGSLSRMLVGALAAWLLSHKLIDSSSDSAQFVNTVAPVVASCAGLAWIMINNRLHLTRFFAALYATPPALPPVGPITHKT